SGLVESQISRGSKDSAASIVSTTTAAKNTTPGPGATDIRGCNCTMATVKVSTNTSSIDHRPMNTTIRYRRVRSRLLLTEPRCTLIKRYAIETSLPSGIITLAISTMSASGHDPE